MPFINRCGAMIEEVESSNGVTIYSGTVTDPNMNPGYGIDVRITIGNNDEFIMFGIDNNTCKFHSYTNFGDITKDCTVDCQGVMQQYSMIYKEGSIIFTYENWFTYDPYIVSGTYKWILIHRE